MAVVKPAVKPKGRRTRQTAWVQHGPSSVPSLEVYKMLAASQDMPAAELVVANVKQNPDVVQDKISRLATDRGSLRLAVACGGKLAHIGCHRRQRPPLRNFF